MASLNDSWMPFLAERLAAGQEVHNLKFRGFSMLPMLRQGKDFVDLSPISGTLRKYDLPVYKRSDGKYVMHRIIAVKKDFYVCMGDNTYYPEKICPEQIIGVVSAFKRESRRIEVDAFGYRVYCRFWRFIYPLRKLLYRSKSFLRRIKGVFKKGKQHEKQSKQ